ncbi:carboxypeptidase-like regulatory domain-containing protein [Pontibacter sp. E15-1]|uniref:carboxypeptidase-like regulatory domain-containing protein n=1 Tax=Pontibacter sp. E15-1 TaxID=2919918 RepID=UPI001F4FE954|nr:carboxypeptidase-like regulatory domain-containing protein [Pontibacter sp. E15-1]MCJ8163910.1 carboxypeptidase-like regulatory domain-containing protein [Pontibacter sp. E15-1]
MLFPSPFAQAQATLLYGTVRSGSTQEAIPFVNIGIKKKGLGTAADADGKFKLLPGDEPLQDTLTFSAIGYQELSVPVRAIIAGDMHQFLLTEKPNMLQEVVVLGKAPKIRQLGVRYKMPFLFGSAESRNADDISELAQLIHVHGKSSELLSTTVFLKSSKADSATFRINFYRNADGKPAQRLVEKSIVRRLSLREGWVTVDLQPYGIFVEDDFFIGFEYLPDSQQTEKFLFFYGAVLGGNVYARNVSLGEWRTTAGGKLSAYVTVRQ